MGTEDSIKMKKRKESRKKGVPSSKKEKTQVLQREENAFRASKEKKNKKKKTSPGDILNKVDSKTFGLSDTRDETQETWEENKRSEKLRNNKRKKVKISKTSEFDIPCSDEVGDGMSGKKVAAEEPEEDKFQKSRKQKRKCLETLRIVNELSKEEDMSAQNNGKSKKAAKKRRKSQLPVNDLTRDNLPERREEAAEDEVYQISSGDEDYSKGMKKWIMQYHQSRPGVKVLQERIDSFIMAYDAQEEQAKKEKEARAAEGGWTVVVHHKGRKKSTESETGVAVGSVAQAAVLEKIANKKNKDVGLDFYRFHKREAQRSELMMLQSKFEQDKKRIQQMRAARKFRPY